MADLQHLITIAAPPDKVYAALATEAGMRSWWTADTTMDARVGGKAVFGFGRRATTFRMTVETLEPGKRVVLSCQGEPEEWNGTRLTWTITPEKTGAVLRFAHANWKVMSDMACLCNSTWGELMYRIKGAAEGAAPGPHWTE
jgi:uncharacterized protein YndB with AHSA1/START domain